MFNRKIGTLNIGEAITHGGKKVLLGNKEDGAKIIIDAFSEQNQTAYFYDNKVIVTICRGGYTEDDERAIYESGMLLKLVPSKSGMFMLSMFGNCPWENIEVVPGLVSSFNNLQKGFDSIIFIFTDVESKSVKGMKILRADANISAFLLRVAEHAYMFFDRTHHKKAIYKSLNDLKNNWFAATASDREVAQRLVMNASLPINGAYQIAIDEKGYAKYFW